ncbi:MAG TPA: HlyD family efflux transporter periplasmic adaptor subunit [Polyangiaceae bacterium]|nr:HlyD family efflux transporter periplasmic adaptor subunit [Polyangiaceae bacterium]
MDIPRTPPRRRLRVPAAVAVTLAMALVALAATRTLRSASPSVAREGLVVATVKRGAFERDVRAAGRLVPQETRWVTAITPGRVDSIAQKPGAQVEPDTVILTLQNPDVLLASLEADRDVTTAEAAALELETRLGAQAINEEATVASLEAELSNAERRAEVYGADMGLLVPKLDQTQMADRAQSLSRSLDLARDRVKLVSTKGKGAIAAWREQLARRKKVAEFRRMQVEALNVRAGGQGILLDIAVEPGQWAPPGAVLANVVKPDRLKAELRIPEIQAKDVMIGMPAQIDTHNGVIPGHVIRVAAAAREGGVLVEVALDGALPPGARPQLNVDGTIRIETLPDAVYVDRPAAVFEGGPCRLFRLSPDGEHAERVAVTLGRASAVSIEVQSGLAAGDRIIVSDTSTFDGDRVALH